MNVTISVDRSTSSPQPLPRSPTRFVRTAAFRLLAEALRRGRVSKQENDAPALVHAHISKGWLRWHGVRPFVASLAAEDVDRTGWDEYVHAVRCPRDVAKVHHAVGEEIECGDGRAAVVHMINVRVDEAAWIRVKVEDVGRQQLYGRVTEDGRRHPRKHSPIPVVKPISRAFELPVAPDHAIKVPLLVAATAKQGIELGHKG